MGNNFDVEFMRAVLTAIRDSGLKYMTEVEQYIGEWVLREEAIVVESDYKPKVIDLAPLAEFDKYKVSKIPPIELHLGFNIKKTGTDPAIPLDILIQKCVEAGLDNGGWFIFKNDQDWVYRSNEFSDETDLVKCKNKLDEQAIKITQHFDRYGLSRCRGCVEFGDCSLHLAVLKNNDYSS